MLLRSGNVFVMYFQLYNKVGNHYLAAENREFTSMVHPYRRSSEHACSPEIILR